MRANPGCKVAERDRKNRSIKIYRRVRLPDGVIEQHTYALIVDVGCVRDRKSSYFTPLITGANVYDVRFPIKGSHVCGK